MSLSPAATAQAGLLSAWTEHEEDLGSTPLSEGTFTITDDSIGATSHVLVLQAVGPYTGKGTLADEAVMDQLQCYAEAGSGVPPAPDLGTATVYWKVLDFGMVKGNVSFLYTVA